VVKFKIRFEVLKVVKIHIVTMIPFSRVDGYQCLRGHTASIFKGEVSKARKMDDYIEERGKRRTEAPPFPSLPGEMAVTCRQKIVNSKTASNFVIA
jgi:hypothetical protein